MILFQCLIGAAILATVTWENQYDRINARQSGKSLNCWVTLTQHDALYIHYKIRTMTAYNKNKLSCQML
ncbi:MAG: hypothetical protein LUQ29_05780, partial [Methylococcaceae bacterium]|nr:hypothetical protein [Methylococcaceae bacterium]